MGGLRFRRAMIGVMHFTVPMAALLSGERSFLEEYLIEGAIDSVRG